jgi:hypothetical protein
MRRVGLVLSVLALLALALSPAIAAQPFSDVPQDHWAYNAIEKLASAGLVEGYPDGTYKGKCTMSRYEFAVAIARLMDRVEQLGGVPGPKGEKGDPGVGGGAGLTPEQQALLDRLAKEFAPELKALRADLEALTKRVEELEAAPKPAAPVITVGGSMSWRTGVYGTELGFEDVDSTGYPADGEDWGLSYTYPTADDGLLFGYIVVPVGGGRLSYNIPITDAVKDSYKNGDFMTMQTLLRFSGNLTPNTNVFVQLLAGPTTNHQDAMNDIADNFDEDRGVMDLVQVDQAWVDYTGTLFVPVETRIGKQYLKRGVGLLYDNDQEGLKGLKADFGSGSVRVGTFLGMLDREILDGETASDPDETPTWGQDNINLFYLDWAFAEDWKLGGNYLNSGLGEEQGWSVSLNGPLYGLGLYGEYAQATQWINGEDTFTTPISAGTLDLDESDTAWFAGLSYANPWLCLNAEYGEVDAGYAFSQVDSEDVFFGFFYSALHPRAEFDPHYINWIDRPLFLDPTNIARGWHVQAELPKLFGAGWPLTISYATGDAYCPDYLGWLADGGSDSGIDAPDKWTDADPVWWVKLSHQFNQAVSGNLVYGHRDVDNVLAPVPAGDPSNDALQVIRAEVVVQF